MLATAHLIHTAPVRAPVPVDPRRQVLLETLRQAASKARALPDDDLFRACSVLGSDSGVQAADRFAIAVFQVLPAALGVDRVRTYERGAPEESFDEAWLLAGLEAVQRDDVASLEFLLARRLPSHARRQVAFLLRNLSRLLDTAP